MGERVNDNETTFARDAGVEQARLAQPGGMLSLVGTPIGNLSDASPRVIDTLRSADVLLCEDTRVTSKLGSRFACRLRGVMRTSSPTEWKACSHVSPPVRVSPS